MSRKIELFNAPKPSSTLFIRLLRLPDLDSEEEAVARGFRAYGRFALLRSGLFWYGPARSSHPADTRIGWYWALADNGRLLVSARGAGSEGSYLFREGRAVLASLVDRLARLRVIPKPGIIKTESLEEGWR